MLTIVPEVVVSLALTSHIYRRSDTVENHPHLAVTAYLKSPDVIVVEIRGEFDSGTVLEDSFRLEHFEWYDLTTDRIVDKTPFPGTCDPRLDMERWNVVELTHCHPLKTYKLLDNVDPGADPVRMLEAGHKYRIVLKPQRLWWIAKSKAELFREKKVIPIEELPHPPLLRLECSDELILEVEN